MRSRSAQPRLQLTILRSGFSSLVENGLLSVDLGQVSLAEVLREIVEQAGIEVRIRGDAGLVAPQAFAGLPVEQGIRRLAPRLGLLMHFHPSAGERTAPILRTVHVYAEADEGPGTQVTFVPPPEPAETAAAMDRGVSVRSVLLAEIRDISEDDNPISVSRLVEITGDPDATVRRAALGVLARFGGPEATGSIMRALRDKNRIVRTQAIAALGKLGRPGMLTLVRRAAAQDPDPKVRIAALRTLRAVERNARRQAEEEF